MFEIYTQWLTLSISSAPSNQEHPNLYACHILMPPSPLAPRIAKTDHWDKQVCIWRAAALQNAIHANFSKFRPWHFHNRIQKITAKVWGQGLEHDLNYDLLSWVSQILVMCFVDLPPCSLVRTRACTQGAAKSVATPSWQPEQLGTSKIWGHGVLKARLFMTPWFSHRLEVPFHACNPGLILSYPAD